MTSSGRTSSCVLWLPGVIRIVCWSLLYELRVLLDAIVGAQRKIRCTSSSVKIIHIKGAIPLTRTSFSQAPIQPQGRLSWHLFNFHVKLMPSGKFARFCLAKVKVKLSAAAKPNSFLRIRNSSEPSCVCWEGWLPLTRAGGLCAPIPRGQRHQPGGGGASLRPAKFSSCLHNWILFRGSTSCLVRNKCENYWPWLWDCRLFNIQLNYGSMVFIILTFALLCLALI